MRIKLTSLAPSIVGPTVDYLDKEEVSNIFKAFGFSRTERKSALAKLQKGKSKAQRFAIPEIGLFIAGSPLFSFAHAKSAAAMAVATTATQTAFSVDRAFDPLIQLIRDIANPICYVMFIIGFIYVMVGRANEGFKRMQYAAFGYIGLQLAPGLMSIVKSVGTSIV